MRHLARCKKIVVEEANDASRINTGHLDVFLIQINSQISMVYAQNPSKCVAFYMFSIKVPLIPSFAKLLLSNENCSIIVNMRSTVLKMEMTYSCSQPPKIPLLSSGQTLSEPSSHNTPGQ